MTDLELEVTKLRWRVELFESLFVTFCAFYFEAAGVTERREFVRVLLESLDVVKEAAETHLQSAVMPEDQRELCLEGFAQEMKKMRESFSLFLGDPPQ